MALRIASSGDHLQFALISPEFVEHQHIHVDGTEIIFQNTDMQSLIHQIFRIFFQKSSLSGSQETCDQIDRYHISSFLSVSLICIVITSIILSHNTSRNARKAHIPLLW